MKNKFDSFEMAMLIKEIYSSTMNILSSSLKDSDKRNTYVRFSDKGLEFSKEFRMKINNSFDIVFDKFTNEEGERAIEELRRIKDKIKKIN